MGSQKDPVSEGERQRCLLRYGNSHEFDQPKGLSPVELDGFRDFRQYPPPIDVALK